MSIAHLTSPPTESESDRHDSLVADAFLATSRSSAQAVIAVNGRVLMANASAAAFVDAKDHERLWQSIRRQVLNTSCAPVILSMPGKAGTPAHCTVVADGERVAGVIITLDLSAPAPLRLVSRAGSQAVLPGRSDIAHRTRSEFDQLQESPVFTLVTGEAGTGKSFVAHQLLRVRNDTQISIVDARACDEPGWMLAFADAVATSDALVLRHLDELDPRRGSDIVKALEQRRLRTRVIATAAESLANCDVLNEMFPGRLHLPPLREHIEDIPAIAGQVIRGWQPGRSRYRLSTEARRVLWAYDWPGNIDELSTILRNAADRSPSGIIDGYAVQLPRSTGAARAGRVGLLRQDERQKLLEVLERAGNNKLVAADMLGIARSTLYRKLESLGIAGEHPSGNAR